MPAHIARGNGQSKVRAAAEHVLARQRGPMALVGRTIELARATREIGLVNLLYNMHRAVWLNRTRAQTS